MIRHEWNNLLHGKIEKILLTALRSGNAGYLQLVIYIEIEETSIKNNGSCSKKPEFWIKSSMRWMFWNL